MAVLKIRFQVGILGLAFLPLAIGGMSTGIVTVWLFNPRYMRAMKAAAPKQPAPEVRLEMACTQNSCFEACMNLADASSLYAKWSSAPSLQFHSSSLDGQAIRLSILWPR